MYICIYVYDVEHLLRQLPVVNLYAREGERVRKSIHTYIQHTYTRININIRMHTHVHTHPHKHTHTYTWEEH